MVLIKNRKNQPASLTRAITLYNNYLTQLNCFICSEWYQFPITMFNTFKIINLYLRLLNLHFKKK